MKKTLIIILVTILCAGCGRGTRKGIIYSDDFEKGKVIGWTGGKIQKDITCRGSRYALQGVDEGGSYIPLEQWKKFVIGENTRLSFAYYCDNADVVIINCWSNKHKKNYNMTIRRPEHRKWQIFDEYMRDFGPNIGSSINSIHIAIPNRDGAVLAIDNVRLYNE